MGRDEETLELPAWAIDEAMRLAGEDFEHSEAAGMSEEELIAAAEAAKQAYRRERRMGRVTNEPGCLDQLEEES